MNAQKIGDAAGAVWTCLRKKDSASASVTELKKKVSGFSADEVVAGIGWLARESKIDVGVDGRKTAVSLVDAELCVGAR